MPLAPPDCVVCVWVSVGVFAQISVLPFMCVQSSAGVSVLCVCCSPGLLPPLPSCSNAVETLTHQTQPQAAWVQGEPKEDGRVKGDVLACYTLYVETAEPNSAFFI